MKTIDKLEAGSEEYVRNGIKLSYIMLAEKHEEMKNYINNYSNLLEEKGKNNN